MTERTRSEHLEWCKTRALECLDSGDTQGALGSMCMDLSGHPETTGHPGIQLGTMMMMGGHLSTSAKMREWINGFN